MSTTLSQQQQTLLLLSLGLVVLSTALAALAVGRGRLLPAAAALTALSSATWLALDGRLEGPVLLSVAPGHGVVLADLLVVPGALLVGVGLLVRARSRPTATLPRASAD